MGFGDYPPEYNRNIHGPYDPARYYGKPDTPFGDVKLIELPAWISRRSLNPINWYAAANRAYYRWAHKWVWAKKNGPACYYQIIALGSILMYMNNYQKHWNEMNYKYH